MASKRVDASEWARRVKAWKESGESAARFAKAHGWNPRTLSWWASAGRSTGRGGLGFVEVHAPTPRRARARLEVVLTNGRRVRTATDVEPEALRRLVEALER